MTPLEVIRPGAEVTVQGIAGWIDEVYIGRGNRIRYSFSYWDGNTRKNETIHPHEVDGMAQDTIKIGFARDTE